MGPIGPAEPYTSIRALPAVWQYADTGEYSASDVSILFQNTVTNQVGFWTINSATGQESSSFLSVFPFDLTGWKALNTGFSDFNGDGTDDILFQNTSNGQLVNWNMANDDITPNFINFLGGPVSADWKYKGTGDFTGDNNEDILWQQDGTGAVRVWDVVNNTVTSNSQVNTVSSDWQIRGVGDFQFDGAEDVLWQNTISGQVGYWDFNTVAPGAAPSYSFVQLKNNADVWVGVRFKLESRRRRRLRRGFWNGHLLA